jgi:hypothetical protein
LDFEDAHLALAGVVTSDGYPGDDPHRPLRGNVSFGSVRLRRVRRFGSPVWSWPNAPDDPARYPHWYYVTGTIRERPGGSTLTLWVHPSGNALAALLIPATFAGTFAYTAMLLPMSYGWAVGPLLAHLFFQWQLRKSVQLARVAIGRVL